MVKLNPSSNLETTQLVLNAKILNAILNHLTALGYHLEIFNTVLWIFGSETHVRLNQTLQLLRISYNWSNLELDYILKSDITSWMLESDCISIHNNQFQLTKYQRTIFPEKISENCASNFPCHSYQFIYVSLCLPLLMRGTIPNKPYLFDAYITDTK